MTFSIDPGPLARAVELACVRLERIQFADALWARRLDVWSEDPGVARVIAGRLGWLDAIPAMRAGTDRLHRTAQEVRDAAFTDVVLLGMGGSSLAPEVLRAACGAASGPRFHVLDSIDPDTVRPLMARAETTLFLLASKSGSTIELTTLAAEAQRRLRAARVADPGAHCIAITDEGSPLHRRAIDQRFRDVFINAADIGGRFSALSFFGLVPAALMGLDIDALLAHADAMAEACRCADPRQNPGLALGAAMAAAASEGRDKLTLVMPQRLERLALWIEQLVAESTGKHGKGILPVAGEPPALRSGADRLMVETTLGDVRRPAPAGPPHAPSVTLDVPDVTALGAEFFRWEVATATAGLLLGINPFDEPNVQQAKDATRALLDVYRESRRLPLAEPDAAIDGVRLSMSVSARAAGGHGPSSLFDLLRPADYFALLAYLPDRDEPFAAVLDQLRSAAGASGCATSIGYGPRYLHSTGQLHKGGPDTGVFLVVTAEPSDDLPVPGEPYSFGVLEMAQAVGDFQALDRAGRRAVHLHLPRRDPQLLLKVAGRLLGMD